MEEEWNRTTVEGWSVSRAHKVCLFCISFNLIILLTSYHHTLPFLLQWMIVNNLFSTIVNCLCVNFLSLSSSSSFSFFPSSYGELCLFHAWELWPWFCKLLAFVLLCLFLLERVVNYHFCFVFPHLIFCLFLCCRWTLGNWPWGGSDLVSQHLNMTWWWKNLCIDRSHCSSGEHVQGVMSLRFWDNMVAEAFKFHF